MKLCTLGLLVGLFCLAGGCTQEYPYSFKVWVRNDSPKPIMIWLTKDGPPVEDHWLSPEELAEEHYDMHAVVGGATVPPGGVAQTPSLTGRFQPGTHAVLRVYRGQLRMADILAISPGSPNRVDVMLQHEGLNRIRISDTDGHLGAEELPDGK